MAKLLAALCTMWSVAAFAQADAATQEEEETVEIHCGGGSYDIGDPTFHPLERAAEVRCQLARMEALSARYTWMQARACPADLGGRDDDRQQELEAAFAEKEAKLVQCIRDHWLESAVPRAAEICAAADIERRLKLAVNSKLPAKERARIKDALPAIREQAKLVAAKFKEHGAKPAACTTAEVKATLRCALPELKDTGKAPICYSHPFTGYVDELNLPGLKARKKGWSE